MEIFSIFDVVTPRLAAGVMVVVILIMVFLDLLEWLKARHSRLTR
jgi:ABC-type transporter Mla maintaining outer membrane lipid asymmetry permease subunit MlaE